MSNSLQEQLLALGLAKEKPKSPQTRKAGSGSGQRRPKPGKSGASKAAGGPAKSEKAAASVKENISLAQAYSIREQEEKSAKQRARERKIEEDRKRAVINKRIREIVDAHRLNQADASESRYFMYKERIRKVYATPEQLASLNDGSMGVVYLAGGYHIMSAGNIDAVRQVSAEHVVDLLAGSSEDDEMWAACEQPGSQADTEPADGAAAPEDPQPADG